MTAFRQIDMQRRAGVKGPATRHALDQLLEYKVIVFSHQVGTNKFYRITGETSVALGLDDRRWASSTETIMSYQRAIVALTLLVAVLSGGGACSEPSGRVIVSLRKPASVTLPSGVLLGQFKGVLQNAVGSRTELALTDADGDGTFDASFHFVGPGDYAVDIKASEGVTFTTLESQPAALTLGAGQAVSRSFTFASVNK